MQVPEFKKIAKIESTTLGVEDHGIFTAFLNVTYGGAGQGVGGYCLDRYDKEAKKRVGTAYGCEFIARLIRACGVDSWEKVKGRTIFVLHENNEHGKVIGIENLPTEKGNRFIFADLFEELPA
jgi:hypothetical protein